MDSLTHLVAGACLAAAIAPPAHRRLALVAGALLNSLPDVDYAWLAFVDPVERFVGHRGPTHSIFVLPFVALAAFLLLRRFVPRVRDAQGRWLALCLVVLLSHPLLDAMTVYGTRLFWPLSDVPVMHANLFIVDPALTLPLAVAAMVAWILGARPAAQQAVVLGLALSITYIGWTLVAKQHLERTVRAHYAAKGIAGFELLTVPTPFNSIVWRVLVRSPQEYGEGYYSFLGGNRLEIQTYPRPTAMPDAIAGSDAVVALERFTRGWYRIDRERDRHVLVDLRMGAEPHYVFRFAVGEGDAPLDPPEQYPWPGRTRTELARVWNRMFNSDVAPAARADST